MARTRPLDFASKRIVKKPFPKRIRKTSGDQTVSVPVHLDEKRLNVSVRGDFYEKASSRRCRHRAALMASGSASEAVPLALLRRRSSSSNAERRPSANRVLVAPQFEEDPNLQAVKGKPVSFKGKAQLACKVRKRK